MSITSDKIEVDIPGLGMRYILLHPTQYNELLRSKDFVQKEEINWKEEIEW